MSNADSNGIRNISEYVYYLLCDLMTRFSQTHFSDIGINSILIYYLPFRQVIIVE